MAQALRRVRAEERRALTLGGVHDILDLLDEPLDLLAGALELLLVALQVVAEGGAVRQAVRELQRLQAHAHPGALSADGGTPHLNLTAYTSRTFTARAPSPPALPHLHY